MTTLYHLSPVADLDKLGLIPGKPSTASRTPMPHVYVGTLEYIENDYLEYVKPGVYRLYAVETDGLDLDKRAGDQWRTGRIDASRVSATNVQYRVTKWDWKKISMTA